MNKIVITGATGLIGSALIRQLAGMYDIVVITRDKEKACNELGTDNLYVAWNEPEELVYAVTGAKAVINLAGENIGVKRWTKNQKNKISASRSFAGKKLKEAINRSLIKPELFIQMSAVNYYTSNQEKEYTESDTCTNSSFLHKVVKKWESSANYVSKQGIRHIIVRCGIVLDKNSQALRKLILPFRLFAGGPVGTGNQWVSWIHIEDVINAIMFLMENKKAHGIYNLVSPSPLTNSTFGKQIAKTLKRPYWFKVPSFVLKLMFGQMAEETILSSQKVIPDRLLREGFKFNFNTIETSLNNLLKQ